MHAFQNDRGDRSGEPHASNPHPMRSLYFRGTRIRTISSSFPRSFPVLSRIVLRWPVAGSAVALRPMCSASRSKGWNGKLEEGTDRFPAVILFRTPADLDGANAEPSPPRRTHPSRLFFVFFVHSFELPFSATDGAFLFRLRSEPFVDALQVEGMAALSPHHGAVVPWKLGFGRTRVVGCAANPAHVVSCVPGPAPHGPPLPDLHVEAHPTLFRTFVDACFFVYFVVVSWVPRRIVPGWIGSVLG